MITKDQLRVLASTYMRRVMQVQSHWVLSYTTSTQMNALADVAEMVPEGGVVVEIGSFCGGTTRALALGTLFSGASLVTIDPGTTTPDGGSEGNWLYQGDTTPILNTTLQCLFGLDGTVHRPPTLKHVELLRMTSQQAAKGWQRKDQGVDILFVDGDHTRARQDVEEWLPFLQPWGLVILDDCNVGGRYGAHGPDNTLGTYLASRDWGHTFPFDGRLAFISRDPGFWHGRAEALRDLYSSQTWESGEVGV